MGNLGERDARLVRQAQRRREALALRLRGLSYVDVGKAMGISHTAAAKLVKRETARIPKEEADALRTVELLRLDEAHQTADELRRSGDPEMMAKGITGVLRVNERRCRMLGLDAPTKLEAAGDDISGQSEAPEVAAMLWEEAAKSLRKNHNLPPRVPYEVKRLPAEDFRALCTLMAKAAKLEWDEKNEAHWLRMAETAPEGERR